MNVFAILILCCVVSARRLDSVSKIIMDRCVVVQDKPDCPLDGFFAVPTKE